MTALVQDKKLEYMEGVELPFDVYQATELFGGSFVCARADGYVVPGDDASGLIFEGVATGRVDNSAGLDGDKQVVLRRRGLIKAIMDTAITIANIGDQVFLVDDQTVDLVANVTHNIFCGVIAGYIDTTHAWIDIEPAIKHDSVDTHIADADGAHAASAISVTDAGNHFAAAENTAEAALQKLAKAIVLNFSAQTIATAASDDKIAEDFELPVPVRIKQAYANLGTAPGAGKTLTIELNGDTTLVAIADTATKGEDEALDIAIAANTDFDITVTQDTGAADGLNLMLIAEVDDGE